MAKKMTKEPEAVQETGQEEEKLDVKATLLEGQDVSEEDTGNVESGGGEEPQAQAKAPATEASEEQEEALRFIDYAKQMGYQGDDQEEASMALLGSFSQLANQYDQLQRKIQEQEELARLGAEHLKSERTKQVQQPQEIAEQQEEHWWKPPEFKREWLEKWQTVALDENGNPMIGWKKETPNEIQRGAREYQDYIEQWVDDLARRPHEILPKVIEHEFNRLFEERFRSIEEQRRVVDFADQVRQRNADWMYTQTPDGREQLTQAGAEMSELINEIAASGVQDPEMQWKLAVAMYDYLHRPETPEPETPEQVAATQRREHLKKGATRGTQNRKGSVTPPEHDSDRAQNPNLSPGEQLLYQLRQDGADV